MAFRTIDHGSFIGRRLRKRLIDTARSIQIGIRIRHGDAVEDMTASAIAGEIVAMYMLGLRAERLGSGRRWSPASVV